MADTRLVDTTLVTVTALVGVAGVVSEYLDARRPVPPLAGAIALTVVACLLLLLRRRFALASALGVLGVCVVYHLVGYSGLAVAAPLYPACYHLVSSGRTRKSLAVGSLVALGVPMISFLPPYPPGEVNISAIGGVAISLVAMLAVADARRAWSFAARPELR